TPPPVETPATTAAPTETTSAKPAIFGATPAATTTTPPPVETPTATPAPTETASAKPAIFGTAKSKTDEKTNTSDNDDEKA
ncbi:MAG: hypothetical protein COB14_09720, partial [Alphaproteobacteria bacterium]